jgi:hypothetical protein
MSDHRSRRPARTRFVFDAEEHRTDWWLKAGCHLLTMLLVYVRATYRWAALRPPS